MKLRILAVSACATVALACGAVQPDDPVREVTLGLGSSGAVARSAMLALDAIAGTSNACVTVNQACTTYPCNGSVTVTQGAGCAMPLGGAGTGSVTVTGQWTSATKATVSTQFTDVKTDAQKALAVANVTQVSVEKVSNTVTVKFTGANATAGTSGTGTGSIGSSNSWEVAIDTKATADIADDVYTVKITSAGGSAGTNTSAKTVTFDGVVINPSVCTKNPIAGSGKITEVKNFIPNIVDVKFVSACDGKVEVNGSLRDGSWFL